MTERDTSQTLVHAVSSVGLEVNEDTQRAAATARQFLTFAKSLADHSSPVGPQQAMQALNALVALCVRQYQAELLTAPLIGRGHAADSDPFASLFHGPLDAEGRNFFALAHWREEPTALQLKDGLIWASPWEPERYRRALLRSGPGWRQTTWKQHNDQTGVVYLPWGLYCVENGNHSAASGILQGDGVLVAHDVCDLTPVLQRVELGEQGIVREDTGALVGTHEAWSVLALIGLGKLLVAHQAGGRP